LAEKLVEYEVNYHGLDAVILRPFMMYDEEEDLGDHRSALIRFATSLALGKPIEVHKGSARGWFHVSDAIRSIEAATRINTFETINIGNPDIRPISELAEMICTELGADPRLINYCDIPAQMTPVKNPTFSKQSNLLGTTPQVSLEEGIKIVCENVCLRLKIPGKL